MTPNAVGLSLTLFSATYVPFHPINTILSFIIGPQIWISTQLLWCGIISTSHAAIADNTTLIVLRLLLGVFEAGYNPCCLFLMSKFYPRHNLAMRMGFFTCMFAAAGASAGAITYGLLSVVSKVLKGWQLVFLVEGVLPMLNAAAVFFMVPRSIGSAKFLTTEQRAHAVTRMKADKGELVCSEGDEPVEQTARGLGRVTWRDFTDVMTDLKKLLIIVFGIPIITSMNAFPAFLPVLVEGMGYEGTLANMMSVPPFVAAILFQILGTWLSDKHRERSYVIIGSSLPAAVAAIVMAASGNNAARYAASHFCVGGVMIGGSLISVWLANNTSGSVRTNPSPRHRWPFTKLHVNGCFHVGLKVVRPRP